MEKIKDFLASEKGKDILTVIIIILVGSASFGLGRLSRANDQAGIQIEYTEPGVVLGAESVTTPNVVQKEAPKKVVIKTYFASSRGSKYYHLGCSGGKTLKEENKIYFSSSDEAERAGYELSSSCR